MRTFDVFANSQNEVDAVKQGFSWPACLIGGLWAFSKGMPLIGIGLLVGLCALQILAMYPIGILVDLLILYAIGANGNGWLRTKLTNKGYKLMKSIEAKSPQAAIVEYHRLLEAGELLTETDPEKIAAEAKKKEKEWEAELLSRAD